MTTVLKLVIGFLLIGSVSASEFKSDPAQLEGVRLSLWYQGVANEVDLSKKVAMIDNSELSEVAMPEELSRALNRAFKESLPFNAL
jgi:hypothetical protein